MSDNNSRPASPTPAINAVNTETRIPINEIIAQLRIYDGHSDAREFMSRFRYDLKSYKLSLEWGLRNLDRALTGDAAAWWSARWHDVEKDLNQCNNIDAVKNLFEYQEAQLFAFFDNSSKQSLYRRENKSLKFSLGDCPTKYVTQKLKILRLIDADMSESKKITQIIKGLSYDLRQTMTLQGIYSVNELLEKLRSVSEVYFEHSSNKSPSSLPTPMNSYSSIVSNTNRVLNPPRNRNNNEGNFFRNFETRNGNTNYRRYYSDQIGPVYPKGKFFTDDGRQICNYCHYAGHTTFNCQELTRKNQQRGNRNPFNPNVGFNASNHVNFRPNHRFNNQSPNNQNFYETNRRNVGTQLFTNSNFQNQNSGQYLQNRPSYPAQRLNAIVTSGNTADINFPLNSPNNSQNQVSEN